MLLTVGVPAGASHRSERPKPRIAGAPNNQRNYVACETNGFVAAVERGPLPLMLVGNVAHLDPAAAVFTAAAGEWARRHTSRFPGERAPVVQRER
jgi:hypothetical protein